jgi:predicted kinase
VRIVVSGLPASGKTTLALALGERLGLTVIDKDVVLETLYDTLGAGDHAWRERLSRSSDEVLYALAASAPDAVLVNWWHHDTAPARLRALPGAGPAGALEVHCACDPAVAAERFRARVRHPGHLDPVLTDAEVAERVAVARRRYPGPLRLGGPLITVDTASPVDLDALARDVRARLPAAPDG